MKKKIIPLALMGLLAILALACATLSFGGNGLSLGSTATSPAPGPTSVPPSPTPTEVIDAGQAGLGDPYYPYQGNAGYDAINYTLDLDVDVPANTITGTVTMQANATDDLESFNLDFLGFTIDEIQVDGQAADFSRDGSELTINPAEPLTAGQAFSVATTYHGVPLEGVKQSQLVDQYSVGWAPYAEGVYVAGEPSGSQNWYPVNEHPSDKASYDFIISVTKPYEVAANGLLESTTEDGDWVTYVWHEPVPMAAYLVTLGLADFDVVTAEGPNGLPIRNYFGLDVPQSTRDEFDILPDVLQFYSDTFGPYPFEAAGAVVHDVSLNFSLETATMVVFGNSFVNEEVIAHEFAHQWFGDSVGLKQWKDLWLNEGFATYVSWLWFEHSRGPQAMDQTVRNVYEYMVSGGNDIYMPLPGDPGTEDLFAGSVYYRGALALHALRLQVGDDAFFDIMRTYYDRYKGGNASIPDFIAVAEEVSGQQLDDLFNAWLYTPEIPDMPELGLHRGDFLD